MGVEWYISDTKEDNMSVWHALVRAVMLMESTVYGVIPFAMIESSREFYVRGAGQLSLCNTENGRGKNRPSNRRAEHESAQEFRLGSVTTVKA